MGHVVILGIMKPSLQLRMSQQLTLTPQLQQSIRLLQLSTLELQTEIEQALSDNPLLERLDDVLDNAVRLAPNGAMDGDTAWDAGGSVQEVAGEAGADFAAGGEDVGQEGSSDSGDRVDYANGDEGVFGERLNDWASEAGSGSSATNDDSEDDRGFVQAQHSASLREHLSAQLQTTRCTPQDRALVSVLIDEVNADGYLELELDEAATLFPAQLEIGVDELQVALRMLQSFEPAGVGARNVAECLALQLKERLRNGEVNAELAEQAMQVAQHHLDLLAARDFVRLKRVLQVDDDGLKAIQALIRSLDPRPGAAYGAQGASYVMPDVVVRKVRNSWIAMLNNDAVPRLRVNEMYAGLLKRNRGNTGGMASQLQEARWLIKNVAQRFDTILRVSQAIVDRQREFFTHGAVAMRPLVLREIAETVSLHESTVSRVTTQKFMLTPFGTFELKYFFGSHLTTDAGGSASSTAIRELIRQFIEAEDSADPLSDSRIADLLGAQGVQVARRTVAKYREAMQIPPVGQRKTL
jgi:RNA polymerase sigma-54 factor